MINRKALKVLPVLISIPLVLSSCTVTIGGNKQTASSSTSQQTASSSSQSSSSSTSTQSTSQANIQDNTQQTDNTDEAHLSINKTVSVCRANESTEIKFVIQTNKKGDYSLYTTGKTEPLTFDSNGMIVPPGQADSSFFTAGHRVAHFKEATSADALSEDNTNPTDKVSPDIPNDAQLGYIDDNIYYTATITINMPSAGLLKFYAGTPLLNASSSILVVDALEVPEVKGKYIKEFNKTYNELYSKWNKRIIKDCRSGDELTSMNTRPQYYGRALAAAEKVCQQMDSAAMELEQKGAIIKREESYKAYTITWADGTSSGWNFNLDLIQGLDGGLEEMTDKPVIYLYPEKKTDVTVSIDNKDGLTTLYPAPDKKTGTKAEWAVTADTDGTLTDKAGQKYNYLYWEGKNSGDFDFSRGFCVKGSDTAEFLDKALDKLGLTRQEANEFIVYWLPQMEKNPYNVISFQADAYTKDAELKIAPEPDTLIRVFMAWYPSSKEVDVKEQKLTAPTRNGFTAVEWGGSKVNRTDS